MIRHCQCGKPISRTNKSGKCKPCSVAHMNSDPKIKARRATGIVRGLANMSEENRAKRREQGLRLYQDFLSRPEMLVRLRSPEVRAKAGRGVTEAKIGWCPPERRDHYRYLTKSLKVPCAEARRMIEAEIPGTEEHTLRMIANRLDAKRIRDSREQAY